MRGGVDRVPIASWFNTHAIKRRSYYVGHFPPPNLSPPLPLHTELGRNILSPGPFAFNGRIRPVLLTVGIIKKWLLY